MCLSCIVDAKEVVREIVPGYQLYVATKQDDIWSEDWPVGWYGIVQMNGPDFVFHVDEFLRHPFDGMTEEQENSYDDSDPIWDAFDRFANQADKMDFSFEYIETFISFYEGCKLAGYDYKESGALRYWLMNRIAKVMGK